MDLTLITKTDSTDDPITLDQLKAQSHVDGTDEDANLQDYIWAARDYAESETGVCFTDSTYDQIGDRFPAKKIRLLKKPVLSVSVNYYNTDNTLGEWDSTNYYTIKPSITYAWIEPKTSWPAIFDRPDAVQIRFVVGMTSMPHNYKHLVKMVSAAWYVMREGEVVGTISTEMKLGVQDLINQFRVSL